MTSTEPAQLGRDSTHRHAPIKLSAAQRDRAAGVLLALAAGDALGAGYEFGPALPEATTVEMKGGGTFRWAPGEWTDDTSMAIVIARAAATGADLLDDQVQSGIVAEWVEWAETAPDVGIQLRAVLNAVGRAQSGTAGVAESSAASARRVAREHHERNRRSAGNGSLMRTAPIALAYLHSGAEAMLAEAARALSDLTHFEPDAGDACVLWCLAIRHAVLTAELDVRVGISALPAERRDLWLQRIADAERRQPAGFAHNGWAVEALEAAWSAIVHTQRAVEDTGSAPDATQLRLALEAAVRGGRDTDTVAAIAGGLLGARWGASAVPAAWRRILHGWPGLRAQDLVELATDIARGGRGEPVDYSGYGRIDTLVRHPHDSGVYLGAVGTLEALPANVDAIVSLCRVNDTPEGIEPANHVQSRLIDEADAAFNPNLGFVLEDAAAAVAALRAEGRTVLLHCVQAQSRTPTVAALYATRYRGVPADRALAEVMATLPSSNPNRGFRAWYATSTDARATEGEANE